MSSLEWENADVKMNVSAKSLKESNLVLRKFYNEIAKKIKVAWNFQPYRMGKVIFVGMSTFGNMWFDYKQKGLINNIYVSTSDEESKSIVINALKEAVVNYNNFEEYNIRILFFTDDISFATMCRKEIKIETVIDKDKGYITGVTFSIKAYGKFDLQYIITQKINYLKHLLCAYTNFQFELIKWQIIDENVVYEEKVWSDYELDWIDYFFVELKKPIVAELIPDCFDMFRLILDNDSYEKTMRLLLNSAQEIYCGKLMLDDVLHKAKYNIPGYVDIIDTIFISALEPLSNIGSDKTETCHVCGNVKYKIRKKVEILCKQYMNEYLTKEISNIGYGRRSSFLHEGNARTNEFYCGRCMPLINPSTMNTMLMASSVVDINMLNYVTYIFRQKVHDLLVDKTLLLS